MCMSIHESSKLCNCIGKESDFQMRGPWIELRENSVESFQYYFFIPKGISPEVQINYGLQYQM